MTIPDHEITYELSLAARVAVHRHHSEQSKVRPVQEHCIAQGWLRPADRSPARHLEITQAGRAELNRRRAQASDAPTPPVRPDGLAP